MSLALSRTENEDTSPPNSENGHITQPAQVTGRTLLPAPIASTVSAVTGVTALGWKVTSKVGGWWISAARETTLTSLEITRLATEAVLHTVSRDVSNRTGTTLGRAEAEGILERAVAAFHSTISTVSIIAASGFYASSAGLNSVSAVSIHGLATLNAILGSTETSRAVAAIITLIRDELNKGSDTEAGPVIGYTDLVSCTIGFVLLQRWGRRKTELAFRDGGGEEVIWDTVIDDKGFRADVVGIRQDGQERPPAAAALATMGLLSPAGDEELDVLERVTTHDLAHIQLSPADQTVLSDEELRDQIMRQLPPGAKAQITSSTITAKTIKVDIFDSQPVHIDPPDGTIMLAESLPSASGTAEDNSPCQTIIFRTALKRTSSTKIDPVHRLASSGPQREYVGQAEEDRDVVMTSSPVEQQDNDDESLTMHDSATRPRRLSCALLNQFEPSLPVQTANQKRSRKPMVSIKKATTTDRDSVLPATGAKEKHGTAQKSTKTKEGPLKKALKSLSPSTSSTAVADQTRRGMNALSHGALGRMTALPPRPPTLKPVPSRPLSRSDGRLSGRVSPSVPSSNQPQSYFTVRESRRDSITSQTDRYSIHSVDSRSASPTFSRTQELSTNTLTQARSDVNISMSGTMEADQSSERHHQRSRSFVPSLYSMTTGKSEDNIILAPKTPIPRMSIYQDHKILAALISDGKVSGMFPKDQHLVRIVRRFARFSSASYGSNFLRVMGLSSPEKLSKSSEIIKLDEHHEHNSFSNYTGLPPHTILLSSYYDSEGVSGNTEWSPSAISPLIHFISIDSESKAVVLTCRGTLGFEDVLTDMACDFDELRWQGQLYKVHKGVHHAARRMLGASGSRIMATLKASLEEYPDYGLVLCGHSLGGAVAALLAILISEPSPDKDSDTAFITAQPQKFLMDSGSSNQRIPIPVALPAGRPIHVYAYGPPATCSEELRSATRGLITTVVNHADIVPSLSIGMLHDCRSVAVNLKNDTSGAVQKLTSRIFERLANAIRSAFYVDQPPPIDNLAGDGLGEDNWAWLALARLRSCMTNEKLVPPGEVFVVETTRVFDRQEYSMGLAGDTATERVYRALGRPATRVQFKIVHNVRERFGELRFGRNMFSDHSPGRYESNLAALERGILET